LEKNGRFLQSAQRAYLQEMKALNMIGNHSGIVKMKTNFETDKYFCIMLEFVEGMDLFSFMQARSFQPLAEIDSRAIFSQVLDAIVFAHQKGVAHMDIKLENLLLDLNHCIKIGDWGLSVTEHATKCSKIQGSFHFAAPETFYKARYGYNAFQADVFSLGVVLFALLFGRFPFSLALLEKMRSGETVKLSFFEQSTVGDTARDLLRRMLEPNPDVRISLQDVQKHKWLETGDDIA